MGIAKFSVLFAVVLTMVVLVAGCPSGGPATVPVKGTLTIGGQPANDVTIGLVPAGSTIPGASGKAENGSFQLFTGREGKAGALPGKYKVVLVYTPTASSVADQYKAGPGGKSSKPAATKLPFPEKYKDAATSDKEVEVVDGSNDLKIEIPAN